MGGRFKTTVFLEIPPLLLVLPDLNFESDILHKHAVQVKATPSHIVSTFLLFHSEEEFAFAVPPALMAVVVLASFMKELTE